MYILQKQQKLDPHLKIFQPFFQMYRLVCFKQPPSFHPILYSFLSFNRRWNRLYNIIHFVNLNSLKLLIESEVPQICIRTIHSKSKQVKWFLETTRNSEARYIDSKEPVASLGYFSGLSAGNHNVLHVKIYIFIFLNISVVGLQKRYCLLELAIFFLLGLYL